MEIDFVFVLKILLDNGLDQLVGKYFWLVFAEGHAWFTAPSLYQLRFGHLIKYY